MKKIICTVFSVLIAFIPAHSQEVVVPDSVKSYYKLLQQLEGAYNSNAPIMVIDSLYGQIFISTMVPEWVIANQFEGFALLLAKKGNLT